MNTTKFAFTDSFSIVAIVLSVVGAVLALCQIAVPGIVLAVIGCIAGFSVRFIGVKNGMNARIANIAFIIGIIGAAMAILGTAVAVIIDIIFANAQI